MSLCWCDDGRHTHRMATVIQRVLRPPYVHQMFVMLTGYWPYYDSNMHLKLI